MLKGTHLYPQDDELTAAFDLAIGYGVLSKNRSDQAYERIQRMFD